MPRLSPIPRPPASAAGSIVQPIDPDYDRYYVLDAAGQPVRIYDYTEHSIWMQAEGKGYQILDDLPRGARVWTYFSGWASLRDEQPPMFVTVVQGFGSSKYFETRTWEEAEAMHARVLEKAARKVADAARSESN